MDVAALRRAIRTERRLHIAYADGDGRASTRTVWPIALAFFEQKRILAAWCETRQDFRHFRTDRILSADLGEEAYPRRRRILLAEWRRHEGIAAQD
jgi:predicted DNA-binding transcriptional regulator YafY